MASLPSDGIEGPLGAGQAVRVVDMGDVILREFAGLFRNERKQAAQEAAVEQRAHVPPVEMFISFHLGSQAYALPLADVSEVLAVPRHIATLPRKEDAVLGFAPLRDHLLPILSLATLLGLPQGSLDGPSARMIVARGRRRQDRPRRGCRTHDPADVSRLHRSRSRHPEQGRG